MWTIKTAIGSSWSTWTPHRRTLCLLRRTLCLLTRNFPTMKSHIGTAMLRSILLCLLAHQSLVTVKTTFIFFVPLSDSTMLPSTTDDHEELPADRKKFIPVELLSKDVLSHDVP